MCSETIGRWRRKTIGSEEEACHLSPVTRQLSTERKAGSCAVRQLELERKEWEQNAIVLELDKTCDLSTERKAGPCAAR